MSKKFFHEKNFFFLIVHIKKNKIKLKKTIKISQKNHEIFMKNNEKANFSLEKPLKFQKIP
jgi:hypothetical protein